MEGDIEPDRTEEDQIQDFNRQKFDKELIHSKMENSDYQEYILRLQAELKRYQALLPLETVQRIQENDISIDELSGNRESLDEYVQFLMNSPLIQSYEH